MFNGKRINEKTAAVGKRSLDHPRDSHSFCLRPVDPEMAVVSKSGPRVLLCNSTREAMCQSSTWNRQASWPARRLSRGPRSSTFCLLVTSPPHHCLAFHRDLDLHWARFSQPASYTVDQGSGWSSDFRGLCVLCEKVAFPQGKGL